MAADDAPLTDDAARALAYWGETGRVKVAFEWIFELLETMLPQCRALCCAFVLLRCPVATRYALSALL